MFDEIDNFIANEFSFEKSFVFKNEMKNSQQKIDNSVCHF